MSVLSARANDTDALVIGAGPAGASSAIRLAQAGWRVALVEQHDFPRQKVCGECIAAGNLTLLDELGIGPDFRQLAGGELRKVGWMSGSAILTGEFPSCNAGPYRFGRALGRDALDSLLLERARTVGVCIIQPAKVRAVRGTLGQFECDIEARNPRVAGASTLKPVQLISAAIVIDAHGSWEAAPNFASSQLPRRRVSHRAQDLFAFKARFQGGSLSPSLLAVLAFEGGYGGIVVANEGRITLACCIRRDALQTARGRRSQELAGVAVEATLRHSCLGIRKALQSACRDGSWLSVGPIHPGIRLSAPLGVFRVGNAGGESHPLIGEGISMALQSAQLLTSALIEQPVFAIDARRALLLQRRYASAWHHHFAARLRLAALYAQIAMRPMPSAAAGGVLHRWPQLLTAAARFAGKARNPVNPLSFKRGIT